MKKNRKILAYLRTDSCIACNGLYDNLKQIAKDHPDIELFDLSADDGEEGSRFAIGLNSIHLPVQSVPRTYLIEIEEIDGKRSLELFKDKIDAFAGR